MVAHSLLAINGLVYLGLPVASDSQLGPKIPLRRASMVERFAVAPGRRRFYLRRSSRRRNFLEDAHSAV